jgi:hypothetical protein
MTTRDVGVGDGVGEGDGVEVGDGEGLEEGDGLGEGVGVGDGELQSFFAEPVFRGFGRPVAKSVEFSLVSVQPPARRRSELTALGAGA